MHVRNIHIPRPGHLYRMFVQAGKHWIDDFAPSMGAAISYYTVFSLAPLLVIVIAIAGAIFGRDAVQGQIVAQLGGLIGKQGGQLIQSLLVASSDTDRGLVAGIISVVVLVVGATTVFGELQSALDRIWHVPEAQKPSGIWGLVRTRLLSFGLVLGLVFLLMVSLAVSAGVSAFQSWSAGLFPGFAFLAQALNLLFSLALFTVLFAMIFKLMPSTHIEWRDVWVGGFVTAVLFDIGKTAIGIYLGKSTMTEPFAAAGSLVVLLVWVYYAAQIFLLGAEFTKVYADEHGAKNASQAVRATRETKVLGEQVETPPSTPAKPVAAPGAGPRLAAARARLVETPESRVRSHVDSQPPAAVRPALRAAHSSLTAALLRLGTEVVALAAVSMLGSALHRKRVDAQARHGWGEAGRKKIRRQQASAKRQFRF